MPSTPQDPQRSSRRTVLRAGAALTGLGLAGVTPSARAEQAAQPSAAPAASAGGYRVGRGVADATGEIAEVGMMGYGRVDQQAQGLHNRLRARAFVFAGEESEERVLLVVVDTAMIFESVHQAVLKRLAEKYGDLYTHRNVMLTATHTHCGPGGSSHHLLYNLTSLGFHEKTFKAMTDGITEAATRAHDDLAPSELTLTHAELRGTSANRSREAFERNPSDLRGHFPEGIDPQSTLLRIERDGHVAGAVNWFAVHCTSMSGENKLISADNKGYAAYHWEREVEGVDHLADGKPDFVAAFAQTNAGDMSPNLDLKPPTTPADFGNTRECGLRQYEAAAGQLDRRGTKLTGGVDSRLVYIDLSGVTVEPEHTGDGKRHKTSGPAIGAAMAAGSLEDGPAFPGFDEGENPLWDAISDSVIYEASPELREAQAPKGIVAPVGVMNAVYPWVQEQVPVQLLRIGQLYLIGVPGEVTVCAGLRLRRTVAEAVGAEVRDVLVAGYANSYFHYLTTPEEYDSQQYEGGSTLFGRWQLPAVEQTAAQLARAMRDGKSLPIGPVAPDISDKTISLQPGIVLDAPPLSHEFGDVLTAPRANYRPGERVTVVFAGAHPGNVLHRGGTYLRVEARKDGEWRTVADDGDWSTAFRWERYGVAASKVTVTWDIPGGTASGEYRITYEGDAKPVAGDPKAISGTSSGFTVSG
ncbi:alkaline ceramidase [Streptomyces abyssalis]|uniref:Neutral ceramidase n=1 Tax=Streptomyces abyssalis TaxID=933944 RepID=A0A1E7JTN0_9ACTN|nr:alkaline ceramidase [Streptomyces abyssalis]OEU94303.1 alkaline ceramidase [Streptomyces abyssalis]